MIEQIVSVVVIENHDELSLSLKDTLKFCCSLLPLERRQNADFGFQMLQTLLLIDKRLVDDFQDTYDILVGFHEQDPSILTGCDVLNELESL